MTKDYRDYPASMFWSLDSAIADMVIAAINAERIWDSYRPYNMEPEKWTRIGRDIRWALTRFSFEHNEGDDVSDEEFKQGWKLLGRYFGALWN